MKIKVRAFGTTHHLMRGEGGRESGEFEAPAGSTVADVLRIAGIDLDDVWITSVGGQQVKLDRLLNDGDEVLVFSPVGGG